MVAEKSASRDPEIQRLLDQALEDQGERWGRGERTPVEDYLKREPALERDPEAILDLIFHEYLLRRDLGDNPDPNDYYARFPELAGSLTVQFGLHAAVTTKAQGAGDATGPGIPEPALDERIGEYETLAVLGRGGMGVVYRARDGKLGRTVAIKTIAAGSQATAVQRERFVAEAQAVARLRHPNIIVIHAIGEHAGRPYLSLEFAEGGSLAELLAKKPMAPREAAALVEKLARAVESAHQAGVVHRDLKPSNVLLTGDGIPKVSDFGLAKLLDSDSQQTRTGQLVGTPSYMAPEQTDERAKQIGPETDVYGLGAILYQTLTGRPPFLGASAVETIRLLNSTEVIRPRQLRPDVPRDLETICVKCLEKEPAKRYPSALALADDLRRLLDGRPIAARPVGRAERMWRWGKRNPRAAVLTAAVFLSLALGTAVSTAMAIRASRAEAATRKQRDRAEAEAAIAKAVREFVARDMLEPASPYAQATLGNKPDPDLKVRTALDRAAETIGERFRNQPLVEAAIRLTVGETYQRLGLYRQARPHLERALELRRRVLGSDDAETFTAMAALGSLSSDEGRVAQAEPLLRTAIEGLRKTRGPTDRTTLSAMNDLVVVLVNQERKTEAESLLIETVDGCRASLGSADLQTLGAVNNLAELYLTQNKLADAESVFDQTIENLRRAVVAEHPTTLIAKAGLASVYEAQGRRSDAERLLKEVLGVQRGLMGETHPDTLATMAQLGTLLVVGQHKYDEAEQILLEALRGCRRALDRNNLAAAVALASLSAVYGQLKDWKKAEPFLIEAVDVTRALYGSDSEQTAVANQSAGKLLAFQHEYARAEPYLRDCLAWHMRHRADDYGRFLIEMELAGPLLGQQKYAEAESLLVSAYRGIRARETSAPAGHEADLRKTVEEILVLCKAAGRVVNKAALDEIRADPKFQELERDIKFPANAFAPN